MSTAAVRGVVRQLVLADDSAGPATDAALLTRYARHRDNAAFAELLRRHGPVVLGVCRRILASSHDAEDAFQAVFLVLAKRADAVRPAGQVGNWLYGVAVRTANKAKVAAARRWRREMASVMAATSRERERPESSQEQAELRSIIDAELSALPRKYRAVIVLCDLGGKTRGEAARELGCPDGTVAARLHHGRKLLADRLTRRGIALSLAGVATMLGREAVAADLGSRTLAAADAFTSGAASPAIPPTVLTLTEGMLRTMTTGKFKLMLVTLAGLLLAGGGLLWAGSGPKEAGAKPSPAPPAAAAIAAPAPKPSASPWKETKVLDHAGWLAGSVVYSPDGKTLYVGGTEGHVRAYSVKDWKRLWESRLDGRLAALAIAPDGKTLAATIKDGVRFLDAASGKAGDVLEEKGSEPLTVGFFPDWVAAPGVAAHKVIFGSARGQFVKTWLEWPKVSTITASPVAGGKKLADEYAVPLAVDPGGKHVVVTEPIDPNTDKNVLWAWSAGSGEPDQRLEGHKAIVVCAAWSKDGKIIVTGDADGTVITWDAATLKEKARQKLGDPKLACRVAAVAISPDGKHIAAAVISPAQAIGWGAYAEEVFVWRQPSQPRAKISRRQPDGVVEINLGSKDGIQVGTTLNVLPADFPEKGRQSRMRSFRVPDEKGVYQTLEKFVPKAKIEVIEVLGPDQSRARITEEFDDIRERVVTGDLLYATDYQPEDLKPISRAPAGGLFQGVASLAFAPDGKVLASAFCNFRNLANTGELVGKVRVFTLEAEKPKPDASLPDGKYVSHVEFSPDGKRYLVLASGKADVFDAATGQNLYSVDAEGARFLTDGKSVIAMGPESVNVHDVQNGKITGTHERPKPRWDWHLVRFSPDGKRYAAHYGAGVMVYDTATGLEPVRLDEQHEAGGAGWVGGRIGKELAWSPDGKQVAAVGVFVAQGKPGAAGWDVESGKRFYHFPTDLTDGPLAVAFSTDSQAIAVGYQKRVDVWTGGRNPAKELGVGPVTALAFSPDGKFVAAGIRLPIRPGGDGKDGLPGFHTQVRLIDVATDKVVKVFDGFEGVNPMAATRLPVTALAFSPDGKKLLAGTGFPPITPLPDDLPKAGEFKLFDTWPEALIEKNSRSPSGRRSR